MMSNWMRRKETMKMGKYSTNHLRSLSSKQKEDMRNSKTRSGLREQGMKTMQDTDSS